MLLTESNAAEVARFSPRHLAFVIPLMALHLGCLAVFIVGVSPLAVTLFVVTTFVQVFGITAGFHRLLAHRSYRTSRPLRLVIALMGVLAGQNGPLWWVAHHRHHHSHADREGDTHSPRQGFFWGHMGWLFSERSIPLRDELVRDLARLPEMVFLERYYYLVTLGYAGVLFMTGGWQLVVWGSVMSTVFTYHAIWSANSVCHRFGSRRFPTNDDSRNNFLVALVTLGDGWHHNHHFSPYSVRHGFRWWEIDVNYMVLRALAALGLVWDLKLPPERVYQSS